MQNYYTHTQKKTGYKRFMTSNFADGKNIQFTIRTLSRPTLPITVTETVVKAQRNLRWEIEMMKVESGSHRGSNHPPFST